MAPTISFPQKIDPLNALWKFSYFLALQELELYSLPGRSKRYTEIKMYSHSRPLYQIILKITAVTTNTHPRRVFSLCWNLSFGGRQSTVSMVFSRALTEKVPLSSLNELTRIISNDDGVFNYFIKMKEYIVEPTRSLRPEWNSRNTLYGLLKVLRLFIYLIVWFWFDWLPWTTNCKGSSINSKKRKISYRQGTKFPLNGGFFSNRIQN